MLVVDKRKKGFLKLETVHFLEDFSTYKSDADIVRFMQSKNCPSNINKLYTLHIDLLKEMDEIYSGLNKKTKKIVMKAENNGNFSYNFNLNPNHQDICEFYDFYCSFCKKKDIDPVSLIDIEKYLKIGALTLVSVSDLAIGKLSFTCYIRDDKYVRAWFTCSNFSDYEDSSVRNLIGMANRYSVCKSIEAFKRLGMQVYDCGGVTLQKENIKMCNIDRYKMEFSNNVIEEYNFCYGKTIKGKIMLRIYYLVHGLKNQ